MKLAPDYETAKGHYDELGGLDLAPDIITLSTLISKAPDYETAKGHYDELGEQNLDVDLAVLSEMISRAPDYQSAKQYYEKAKASKLAPDEIFFNVLIDRSDSYPVARGWYNEMRKAGLVPNRFIVTTLVRQSTSFGDRFALVRKLIADGQRAGEMVYGALMAKTRDYAIVTEIISRMKRTGLKPDLFIYRHAISCAGSMEKALPIVKEMVSECIEPDDYTWRFLARYGIYYEDI